MTTQEIIEKIQYLKQEKNALILAHYYQSASIQDMADFVGDSLELAKVGAKSSNHRIILCGVRFMAESAKILSKDKIVQLPNSDAGCPMADMVSYEALLEYKQFNPDRFIVSYVNTNATVKTLSDICVTSSNAVNIVAKLQDKKLLFLPDQHLGTYVKQQFPKMDIELWPGFCITHHRLRKETLSAQMDSYPLAKVLAHPECSMEVLELADFIGSTKAIIEYVSTSSDKEFIIATEEGILHPLQKNNPEKTFILGSSRMICQNMKKTTLEDIYQCLMEDSNEILLDDEVIRKASIPLERMLALSI